MIKRWKVTLLSLLSIVSMVTSAFSVWISYGNGEISGNIIVDDSHITKENYIDLSFVKQETKASLNTGLPSDHMTTRTKNYIHFNLDFKKKTDSIYTDSFFNYFDVFDSNNFFTDINPYIYSDDTKMKYCVDFCEIDKTNQRLKTGYYYDQADIGAYDQIDNTRTNVASTIQLLDTNATITDKKTQVKFDNDGTGWTDNKVSLADSYSLSYLRQKRTTGSSDTVNTILYFWYYNKLTKDNGEVKRIKYATNFTVKTGTSVSVSLKSITSTGKKGNTSYLTLTYKYTGTDGKEQSSDRSAYASSLARKSGTYYNHPTVYREIDESTLEYHAVKKSVAVDKITWSIPISLLLKGDSSLRNVTAETGYKYNATTGKYDGSSAITTPTGYQFDGLKVCYDNTKTQPYFIFTFKNDGNQEIKYKYNYNTGGLSPIGFTRLFNNLNNDTINYQYRIRLRPKSGYEAKAREIASSFDFELSHEIEEYIVP